MAGHTKVSATKSKPTTSTLFYLLFGYHKASNDAEKIKQLEAQIEEYKRSENALNFRITELKVRDSISTIFYMIEPIGRSKTGQSNSRDGREAILFLFLF